jgi:hypothetical protein
MEEVCETPNSVINDLHVKPETKDLMKEMFQKLSSESQNGGNPKHNGGKTKNNRMRKFKKLIFSNKQRRKKTSKKYKRGGSGCAAKYMVIISAIVLSLIGVYYCIANTDSDYYKLITFVTTQFRQSIINLFNIADNYSNVQSGKMNTLQAILESFGKLNLFNTGLEKMTAYYNRLKTDKNIKNIEDVIPKPLSNFLDIFCKLEEKDGQLTLEKAKKEVETQLTVNDTVKEIQQSLPQSISGINEFSNVSLRKEGNTIFVENVNPNQSVKIDVKIVDKRLNDPDEDNDNDYYDASETNPLYNSSNKFP